MSSERISIRVQCYEQAEKIYVVSITFSENRTLNTDVAGKSLAEIAPKMLDVFKKAATKLGLPEHASRLKITEDQEPVVASMEPATGKTKMGLEAEVYHVNEDGTTTVVEPEKKFFNEDGTEQPFGPMAVTAKATFKAEIIRNGKVVED